MGNITKLSMEDLIKRVKNKEYKTSLEYPQKPEGYKKDNYVYDENKSVKWNREHREELEKDYREKMEEYRISQSDKDDLFMLDLAKMIHDNHELSVTIVDLITSTAYNENHSYGYEEVVWKADELADFADYVIKHQID